MYSEEVYEGSLHLMQGGAYRPPTAIPCSVCPQTYHPTNMVMALSTSDAVVQARAALCRLDGSWCNASDALIISHIQGDCSIFTGNDPIRCAVAPGTCGSNCGGVPGPGVGDNTMLYVGAGAVAVLALVAVVMATRPKKMIKVG